MNTLNTNEKIPDYFYVFLHSNRMWHLKWNLNLTKTITSASISNTLLDLELLAKFNSGTVDYIPFIPNPDLDMMSPSSFSQREVNEYQVDYNAEIYRRSHDKTRMYPSRFGCIFAFGSIEDAKKAADVHFWDFKDVKKFKLNEAAPTRVVKVNMQVITQMWKIGNGVSWGLEMNELTWEHYWSGGAELIQDIPDLKTGVGRQTMNEGVIWEYLIDGQLQLIPE